MAKIDHEEDLPEQQHWQIVNGVVGVVSSSPESLWKNACSYFQWCDTNPIKVERTIITGKNAGDKFYENKKRAYTIKGLCIHCNVTEEYIRDLRKMKDVASDYNVVITKILNIIYTQNLEYAMVDIFNPIFTAKVLNMEKPEDTSGAVKITIVQGLPELSTSENEVLEKLNLENEKLKKSVSENEDLETTKEQFS